MQEFNDAWDYIKKKISIESIDDLGLSSTRIFLMSLFSIVILTFFFVFIIFGIMGFTTNTTLGAVVNSIMPIFAGALISRAGKTNINEKIARIGQSIDARLSVLTISDV